MIKNIEHFLCPENPIYFLLEQLIGYWRERAAFQRSAFGRSTAGNDVVATIFIRIFFLFFSFFPPCFSHFSSVTTFSHRSARIKKLILPKLLRTPKNLGVDSFPDPVRHFGAPWRPFWILQAVRRCRRLASAPFAARLVYSYCPICKPCSFIENTLNVSEFMIYLLKTWYLLSQ